MIVGDGKFNPFAGGNREAIILHRAKIHQLRMEISFSARNASCAGATATLS